MLVGEFLMSKHLLVWRLNMEYINKETLVSIETDCELGGDWVPASELKESYKLTVPEIKSKLDELGIEYDSKAVKSDLIALLEQHEG